MKEREEVISHLSPFPSPLFESLLFSSSCPLTNRKDGQLKGDKRRRTNCHCRMLRRSRKDFHDQCQRWCGENACRAHRIGSRIDVQRELSASSFNSLLPFSPPFQFLSPHNSFPSRHLRLVKAIAQRWKSSRL